MKVKYMSAFAFYLTIGLTSMLAQGDLNDILFPTEPGDEIEAPIDDFIPMFILLFAGIVVGIKYISKRKKLS